MFHPDPDHHAQLPDRTGSGGRLSGNRSPALPAGLERLGPRSEISLLPFVFAPGKDGLDLRLHSERVDLSLLTSISTEVQTAEGSLDVW